MVPEIIKGVPPSLLNGKKPGLNRVKSVVVKKVPRNIFYCACPLIYDFNFFLTHAQNITKRFLLVKS